MNYQRIYNELIRSRQKLKRHKSGNCYYEWHHIVPRCLSGSNDRSNLVLLTACEHFVAHRLLTKIYPKSQRLLFAVAAFRTDKDLKRKLTSRQIEVAREANAEATSLRLKTLAAEGSHHWQTEEYREAQAQRQRDLAAEGKLNFQSEEFREAQSKRVARRNQELAAEGSHNWQTEEHREAQSKRMSEQQKALVAEGKLNFQSEEFREAQSQRLKAIVTCPHCGKSGGRAGMQRSHFNNCKSITSL